MPAIVCLFAGMARSYNFYRPIYDFSSTSLNMRSTPVCQAGRCNSNVCRSFVVSIRELCGRLAGVGKRWWAPG